METYETYEDQGGDDYGYEGGDDVEYESGGESGGYAPPTESQSQQIVEMARSGNPEALDYLGYELVENDGELSAEEQADYEEAQLDNLNTNWDAAEDHIKRELSDQEALDFFGYLEQGGVELAVQFLDSLPMDDEGRRAYIATRMAGSGR